jgi:hypothetical protein
MDFTIQMSILKPWNLIPGAWLIFEISDLMMSLFKVFVPAGKPF